MVLGIPGSWGMGASHIAKISECPPHCGALILGGKEKGRCFCALRRFEVSQRHAGGSWPFPASADPPPASLSPLFIFLSLIRIHLRLMQ